MDFGKKPSDPVPSALRCPLEARFAGGAERSPAKPAKDAKYGHLLGGHVAGNGAGIVVDGEITPLAGEPPVAQTYGWGIVLRK